MLDGRVHAARPDIADVALAGSLFASHYAAPAIRGCRWPTAPLRSATGAAVSAVSELVMGEEFALLDVSGEWAWGYCRHDHYVGYLPFDALGDPIAATHRVSAPAALLFAAADIKAPVVARWPMGVRLSGAAEGQFVRCAQGFVHRRHLAAVDELGEDAVTVAERLVGVPYRWGGRSGDGLDCSGLVQLALAAAGRSAPRDSDQQREALGTEIPPDTRLQRGDLVFFPGHVGLMADAERLVHANAHGMAVTIEPLADVVARLSDHAAPIVARRRLAA